MSTNGFPQEIDLKKKRSKKMKWNRNTAGNFFHFLSHFLGFPFLLFLWFVPATQKGELEPRKKNMNMFGTKKGKEIREKRQHYVWIFWAR